MELARDWIIRLHVEEPGASALQELHQLLHTPPSDLAPSRALEVPPGCSLTPAFMQAAAGHSSAGSWVHPFVQQHGIDALCVWLQRLQAKATAQRPKWNPFSRRPTAAEVAGDAMEWLLLCLWALMNVEAGMQAMLSGDGAGVLALSENEHEDASACNLYYLARCIELPSADEGVQCMAIKLLTSAAAYSEMGHARAVAAISHLTSRATGGCVVGESPPP